MPEWAQKPTDGAVEQGSNTLQQKSSVQRHYSTTVQDFTERYRGSHEEYPAESIRLKLILSRLKDLAPGTLLDCGCGEGTPMSRIHDTGVDTWGFDFVPQMVASATGMMKSKGLENRVWLGDVTEPSAFTPKGINVPKTFDVCMALGVLPHIEDEIVALRNMAAVTRKGGRVLVEFRNELFSLFTLNRYSLEFFRDQLIQISELKSSHPEFARELEQVSDELQRYFKVDLPVQRTGTEEAPGYDEILSRFHNPYRLDGIFGEAGLAIDKTHFYHYHVLPPLFASEHPELFTTLSLELEPDPSDWRGHFMASAFVVEAVKETG
jgi:2-polyprenyl-3-methyl-5-hydroxy-6-metoxy-1,4-benzoquinol methylase